MKLKQFQQDAVDKITGIIESNLNSEIIVKSPTGSGKTVILVNAIQEVLKVHEEYIFIWLTPGAGGLEEQSKQKMDKYIHNSNTKLINDILTTGFEAGDTVFINWEMVVNKKNKSIREGDAKNLFDRIDEAKNQLFKFVLVIDEEHLNATYNAETIITAFSPNFIIRASATARKNSNAYLIDIHERDVIESGLIKKYLAINQNVKDDVAVSDQVEYLLELAFQKEQEIITEYKKIEVNINPLVIVQIPPKSDELIEYVEKYLFKKGINYDNGRLAIWLTNRKENLDRIEEKKSIQQFVIIKQAIATGWDCPRAHILVKLRDNMSEVFEIQTIGRIRRMPELHHYNNEILDTCYLYTFDSKYTESVKEVLADNAFDVKDIDLKKEHYSFSVDKQYKSINPIGIDERRALKVFFSYFENKYYVREKNYLDNMSKFVKGGYHSETNLNSKIVKGTTEVVDRAQLANLDSINIRIQVDTHQHGRYLKRAIGEISNKIGMNYGATNTILRRMFQDDGNRKFKVLRLSVPDFYAFVINNEESLKKDLLNAISSVQAQLELYFEETNEEKFVFPRKFMFKYDKDARDPDLYDNNVYFDYLSSAKPRSKGERAFELWCSENDDVKWWYKNGDKSTEYFSILYQDNVGKIKSFYPDYILKIKENIWIIETKGGITSSGDDENIDAFAGKKFNSLKKYAEKKGNFKFGFVRYNKQNDKLYINSENYCDDMSDPTWLYLKKVEF